jgi:ubiquinone/menaquinone biosynthesis C-methylase UbiE
MTDANAIHELWDRSWAQSSLEAMAPLKDRFTVEAFARLRRFITNNDRSILETGCGTGRFSVLLAREFPNATVVGTDVSSSALSIARELGSLVKCSNVTFQEGDVFRIPFPDDSFDVVFSQGVIQLFGTHASPSYVDAMHEMIRVAKPGGKIIISVTNWFCFPHTIYKWQLGRRHIPYEYGYEKSFRLSELIRLFGEVGLHNIESSGYYPSYGFYRLEWKARRRYRRLFHALGVLVDKFDAEWMSRRFGFEIMVKGTKKAILK